METITLEQLIEEGKDIKKQSHISIHHQGFFVHMPLIVWQTIQNMKFGETNL